MPLPGAFDINETHDGCLSVNWIEYFGNLDLKDAIDRIRDVFRNKNYTIKPTGRFAVLNVVVCRTIKQMLFNLEVFDK